MKFGNEFWLILFWEYISPKLFAVYDTDSDLPVLSFKIDASMPEYIQGKTWLYQYWYDTDRGLPVLSFHIDTGLPPSGIYMKADVGVLVSL
jgi:hypothetical protein